MRPLRAAAALALLAAQARAAEPPVGFLQRFAGEAGRVELPEASPLRLLLRGELQLRGLGASPPVAPPEPGLDPATSAQSSSWLRLTPRLSPWRSLRLTGQLDLRADLAPGRPAALSASPRWLYAELGSSVLKFSMGQQPAHLGAGMLLNDGDHPTTFGDYRRGDVVERLGLTFRPQGRAGRLMVSAAAELIFVDPGASLVDGDRALRAVASASYGTDNNQVGGAALVRRQRGGPRGEVDSQTFDLFARFATRAPGAAIYFFGEGEAALDLRQGAPLAWGSALRLGLAHERSSGQKRRFAGVVGMLQWGYASGEGRAFSMHPDHNVGLLLFARGSRDGAVSAATYANPLVIVRPRPDLDLKAGLLIAQATADPRPGQRDRDLGLELDAGAEARLALAEGVTGQVGAQGALLFPGRALGSGSAQRLAMLRAGVVFLRPRR